MKKNYAQKLILNVCRKFGIRNIESSFLSIRMYFIVYWKNQNKPMRFILHGKFK